MPSGVTTFVRRAAGATTRAAWHRVAAAFQPVIESGGDQPDVARKARRGPRREQIAGRPGWSRNLAFEDLCKIFDSGFIDCGRAAVWLGKYVLRRIEAGGRQASAGDTAQDWSLAELFLTEVIGMNKTRIEAIKSFADKVAAWIDGTNDRKLLYALSFDKPWELRGALLRAQRESAKADLLFGLEEFSNVWLSQDGDEYLVRDLVCLRVVERLHASGFFTSHPDTIATPPQEEAHDTEEASA